ncbi:MAG: hypothetical protein ABW167_17855, partial [Baekduia sp.]
AGPAGPQGPSGPSGGVSGLEVIYAASAGGAFTVKSSEAHCPSGKIFIGGRSTAQRCSVFSSGQSPRNAAMTN